VNLFGWWRISSNDSRLEAEGRQRAGCLNKRSFDGAPDPVGRKIRFPGDFRLECPSQLSLPQKAFRAVESETWTLNLHRLNWVGWRVASTTLILAGRRFRTVFRKSSPKFALRQPLLIAFQAQRHRGLNWRKSSRSFAPVGWNGLLPTSSTVWAGASPTCACWWTNSPGSTCH
jgi:hypothetical protein